jgi:hypothetical protein
MDMAMGPTPTTPRPFGLPTRTSQSHLFAVFSERSSGPLSNSPGNYFEHHLRTHSSTCFCMESLDAPLQSRVRRAATTYLLRPRDASCSTSEEALPSARQLRQEQQEQICHGLLLVAYSQGYFQGGHHGISRCRAYPRGYRCLLQLPVKTTEAEEHVCPRGLRPSWTRRSQQCLFRSLSRK